MTLNIVGSTKTVFYLDSNDFTAEVGTVKLVPGESDSDFTTFAEAAAGGARKYTMNIKLGQDTQDTSLWYYIWNELGAENSFEWWPYGEPGDSTPTSTQPKFTGTVVITEPDGDFLGGDADKKTTIRRSVEVNWECTAKPTRVVA